MSRTHLKAEERQEAELAYQYLRNWSTKITLDLSRGLDRRPRYCRLCHFEPYGEIVGRLRKAALLLESGRKGRADRAVSEIVDLTGVHRPIVLYHLRHCLPAHLKAESASASVLRLPGGDVDEATVLALIEASPEEHRTYLRKIWFGIGPTTLLNRRGLIANGFASRYIKAVHYLIQQLKKISKKNR